MKLRRFRPGDEPALLRVFNSAIREIASRDYSPAQIAAWAPEDRDLTLWASHIRTLQPFVVEIAGDIVGYADIQLNGYIDHFFVSGSCAQQGVGTLLMQRLHHEARRSGLQSLTSHVSKTAEGFFLRHGFHVIRRGFPQRRGIILQNALMRKDMVDDTEKKN